jgi:23S rRNA pseudouridine1911/1915/1917 synthase
MGDLRGRSAVSSFPAPLYLGLMPTKEFKVPESLDGVRLDKAALALVTGLSRAQVKRAIQEGTIRVGGRVRAKGASVAAGELLSIATDSETQGDGAAVPTPDAPLVVAYESPFVVVVDKPAGQPTAPLRPGEIGTLANALVGRYPELAGIGHSPREPGLLHRLDTGTSGLVIAARTKDAFETLTAALKAGRMVKEYELVCASADLPDASIIEFPLAKHPKDNKRIYPCVHPRDVMRYGPRPASTSYRVVRRSEPWALVLATVSRALRHQIRAHFAAIGHPLVGDALYAGPGMPPGLSSPDLGPVVARHALHATRVAFGGPESGLTFDVRSPLPAVLAALVPEPEPKTT